MNGECLCFTFFSDIARADKLAQYPSEENKFQLDFNILSYSLYWQGDNNIDVI